MEASLVFSHLAAAVAVEAAVARVAQVAVGDTDPSLRATSRAAAVRHQAAPEARSLPMVVAPATTRW